MKFRGAKNNVPAGSERRRWRRLGARREPTHQPDLEPAHDQPWVPTSGLTDRLRRSPASNSIGSFSASRARLGSVPSRHA